MRATGVLPNPDPYRDGGRRDVPGGRAANPLSATFSGGRNPSNQQLVATQRAVAMHNECCHARVELLPCWQHMADPDTTPTQHGNTWPHNECCHAGSASCLTCVVLREWYAVRVEDIFG